MSDSTTEALDGQSATPSSSVDTSAPTPQTQNEAANPPSPSGPDSTPSPSSGDSRRSDREGLLAAVRSVVQTQPEAPADPSLAGDADGESAGDTVPDQVAASGNQDKPPDAPLDLNAPDPSEAELKKLRPETRKRFERLLAQRNEARTNWEQVQPELTQHRQLQGYLAQHQLAPDDVNALLSVGASLRAGNYQAFLDGVTPYVMAAQEALGLRVARDLQTQVDDGMISEDAARQMTATRHRAMQAEHRLREQSQTHQAESTTRNVAAVRQAVEQWEASMRSRDPDYALKSNAVRRYSQALLQERGIPATPEQAVALTQAAYDEATQEFRRLRPAPTPTRQTPSGIQVATNGVAPSEPRTMKEAALQALASMRRAS